jgi:hypothetical protein
VPVVLARAPILIPAIAFAFALFFAAGTIDSRQPGATAAGGISNIGDFLEQCPTNDARYSQIRSDFEIRKEGSVVGALTCSEPVSAMPVAQYTDELIGAQTLRTIYYMEGGRSVPYPWATGSLYDWMKSKIGGIDVRANNSYCCEMFNGKWFVVIDSQSDSNRNAARQWLGISERIAVIGHETRHVDGFPHVGGCPLFPSVSFGCDQTYDESNLAPYGIQWWLNARWLSGEISVGYSCLSPNAIAKIANGHLNADNNNFRKRFVDNAPPLLNMPGQPGGPCGPATVTPPQSPTPLPTLQPTPTPVVETPTPAPTATQLLLIQGDVDCSGSINSTAALDVLRYLAQFSVSQVEPCPDIGAASVWGDVDCNGVINSVDALKVVRYAAGMTVSQTEPCSDIGTPLQ